jgi:hypothetical protein
MTFASHNLTAGQLNAIVKKLGGEKEALCFLRGETRVGEVSEPAALLHIASLPATMKKTAGNGSTVLCTVFNSAEGQMISFATKPTSSDRQIVSFVAKDGQRGNFLFAQAEHLQLNDEGILSGSYKLDNLINLPRHYTIEFDLKNVP